MSIKLELTKTFLKDANIELTDKNIKKYFWKIWKNPRHDGERSLRLTAEGYFFLNTDAQLKFYQIDFPDTTFFTNQLIIDLDRFVSCPWFLTSESIFVSREQIAVQLILFGGDVWKFTKSKVKSNERSLTLI